MLKAVWVSAAAALLFALTPTIHAQKIKREPISAIQGVQGADTFKAYCAQCHGADGKGTGPVAKALKIPPSDLTQISQRHGGKFPDAEIKQIIMGNAEVLPHGTRDMPLWGPAFRSVEDPAVTELRLANLLRYLESLQTK